MANQTPAGRVNLRVTIQLLTMVEAAGVELFSVLTARKLLILRMAREGKKGTIADSIVRLLYENLLSFRLQLAHHRPSIPQLCSD